MMTSNQPNKDSVTVEKKGVSRKPTITLIRKMLKEAAFNPKESGPMKVLADMQDPHYYEVKAIELIMEAKAIRMHQKWWRNNTRYHEALNQAIQLLALARIV